MRIRDLQPLFSNIQRNFLFVFVYIRDWSFDILAFTSNIGLEHRYVDVFVEFEIFNEQIDHAFKLGSIAQYDQHVEWVDERQRVAS